MASGLLVLIDRAQLLTRCMEDVGFAGELLNIFLDTAPEITRKLRVAVEAGQWDEARRQAHTLKGSAGNLAMESLRQMAEKSEQLTLEKASAELLVQLDQLENCLAQCLAAATVLTEKLQQSRSDA